MLQDGAMGQSATQTQPKVRKLKNQNEKGLKTWSWREESNLRPAVYKTVQIKNNLTQQTRQNRANPMILQQVLVPCGIASSCVGCEGCEEKRLHLRLHSPRIA